MKLPINSIPMPVKLLSALLLLVCFGLIIRFIFPQRSVGAYCNTFKNESERLEKQWKEQLERSGESHDQIAKIIDSASTLAGMPKDLEYFYNSLAKVAPKDIEKDVLILRDAAKKAGESQISTNILQSLTSGLMLGLISSGAQQRVDAYTAKHCEFNTENIVTSNTNSTITSIPTVNPEAARKIWDNNTHGIIAFKNVITNSLTNSSSPFSLVLLDPSNLTILAEKELPNEEGTTADGKKYRVRYGAFERVNFSSNFRYVPVEFLPLSDGSIHVGYYDLQTDKITDISGGTEQTGFGAHATKDSYPFFDLLHEDFLYFRRDGKQLRYSITTKQILPYEGIDLDAYELLTTMCDNSGVMPNGSPDPCYLVDNSKTSYLIVFGSDIKDDADTINEIRSYSDFTPLYYNNGEKELGCKLLDWIDDKHMLCMGTKSIYGKDQFYKVNIGDRKRENKTKPFTISDPVPILPVNERANTYPIVSPDGQTIIFKSVKGTEGGWYRIPVSGGEPEEINTDHDLPYTMLEWK